MSKKQQRQGPAAACLSNSQQLKQYWDLRVERLKRHAHRSWHIWIEGSKEQKKKIEPLNLTQIHTEESGRCVCASSTLCISARQSAGYRKTWLQKSGYMIREMMLAWSNKPFGRMKSTHSEIRVMLLEIHKNKNTHELTTEGEGEEWRDGKQSRCRSVDVWLRLSRGESLEGYWVLTYWTRQTANRPWDTTIRANDTANSSFLTAGPAYNQEEFRLDNFHCLLLDLMFTCSERHKKVLYT